MIFYLIVIKLEILLKEANKKADFNFSYNNIGTYSHQYKNIKI